MSVKQSKTVNLAFLKYVNCLLFCLYIIISLLKFIFEPEARIYDPYIHYAIQIKLAIKEFFVTGKFSVSLADVIIPHYSSTTQSLKKRIMYPLLVALVNCILPISAISAGIIVSILSSFVFFYSLQKLLNLFTSKEVSLLISISTLVSSALIKLYSNNSPQILGLAFFVSALYFLEKFTRDYKIKDILIATLLSILAIFSRETFLIPYFLYLVYYVYKKNRYVIFAFLVVLIVVFFIYPDPFFDYLLPNKRWLNLMYFAIKNRSLDSLRSSFRYWYIDSVSMDVPLYQSLVHFFLATGHILFGFIVVLFFRTRKDSKIELEDKITPKKGLWLLNIILFLLFLFIVQFPNIFSRYFIIPYIFLILVYLTMFQTISSFKKRVVTTVLVYSIGVAINLLRILL